MTDSAFDTLADRLLAHLEEVLAEQGDAERQGGVLTVETDEGTWLLNKHAPTRQMWLSSPRSGARHFAHDAQSGQWKDTRGGKDLIVLLASEFGIELQDPP
jgi:frataxin